MAFSFIPFEVIIFIGVLTIVLRIRNKTNISVKALEGLTVFVPPKDEDFDVLLKTN